MEAMHWSPNLSVGVEALDKDHLALIEALNGLFDSCREERGHDAILMAFDRLIWETREHFAREERLMLQEVYPDYELHKRIHTALLDEIADLRSRFDAGEMEIGEETTDFIRSWLTSHILESDKQLGGFLAARADDRQSATS